jgi:hypothetical protein
VKISINHMSGGCFVFGDVLSLLFRVFFSFLFEIPCHGEEISARLLPVLCMFIWCVNLV